MAKTHLLVSVRLTNIHISPREIYGDIAQFSKVDQFISALHSMDKLGFNSQNFYVTLDEEYAWAKDFIAQDIKCRFPKAKLNWNQLTTYEQWKTASDQVPKDADLILLYTNHDHAYVADSGNLFHEFANSCLEVGPRMIGAISHWPEVVGQLKLRSTALPTAKNSKVFLGKTDWTIGTCLISRELFSEWWREDFTHGANIVRPDNPFGPSIRFSEAILVVPYFELFRHMDGYFHAGINSPSALAIRPCCNLSSSGIKHKNWKFSRISRNESGDLPKITIHNNTLDSESLLELLHLASSHKVNVARLWKLSLCLDKFNSYRGKRLRLLISLLGNNHFRIRLYLTINWLIKVVVVRRIVLMINKFKSFPY